MNTIPGERARGMSYEDRGDNFYVEGGHFDALEDLDAAYPNGEFRFSILTDRVAIGSVYCERSRRTGRASLEARRSPP